MGYHRYTAHPNSFCKMEIFSEHKGESPQDWRVEHNVRSNLMKAELWALARTDTYPLRTLPSVVFQIVKATSKGAWHLEWFNAFEPKLPDDVIAEVSLKLANDSVC